MLPTDVINMKYTVNGRFLWRKELTRIIAEQKQIEELKEQRAEMEAGGNS